MVIFIACFAIVLERKIGEYCKKDYKWFNPCTHDNYEMSQVWKPALCKSRL